jgi:single-stranded-DNA-specific exonuclease
MGLSEIEEILKSRVEGHDINKMSELPNPFLLKDMDIATKKIKEAIDMRKEILIIGDYDVDGITSTSILKLFFESINVPIQWTIPDRFKHGYGIKKEVIEDKVKEIQQTDEGYYPDVIITVDNGIVAFEAADYCKENNIDLIITDHHTCDKNLPNAFAVINPKREDCEFPFKEICGAQVAWYLIAGMKKELGLYKEYDLGEYMDLVAIAIVADIMPLISMNRVMVNFGLKRFKNSKWNFVGAFLKFLKKSSISSMDIGFQLAPRINAIGRLYQANLAVEYITSKESKDKSIEDFERMSDINDERKDIESQIFDLALDEVDEESKIIVVYGKDWHEGVIGIVASKLSDRFKKPTIVLSLENGILKGSGRSVGQVNLYELIKGSKKYLDKFGGHVAACGLSLKVEDFDDFYSEIKNNANQIPDEDFIEKSHSIADLEISDISMDLFDLLKTYEPYGQSNPEPLFSHNSVEVSGTKIIKDKFLSLVLFHGGEEKRAIMFNKPEDIPQPGDLIDIDYTVSLGMFKGKVQKNILIKNLNIV